MTKPVTELLEVTTQQLTQGINGKETEATRGMTLREIVLEMREDIREMKDLTPTYVTRKELYTTIIAVSGFAFGLVNVVL